MRFSLKTKNPSATLVRLIGALVIGGIVAGCDKCGNRVSFNAPSIPNTCGANSDGMK